jgi:hypothetical protein
MSGKTGTAAAPNANQLTAVTMKFRKETKSTFVYDGPPQLPTLYLPKLVATPNGGTPPPEITIVVAAKPAEA